MGMCGPQDPLFMPLLLFTRPPVEAQVHSQDPHLKEKCDISPSKQTFSRKYDNLQLQKFKFDCDFCQKAWKFCNISVLKFLFSMKISSQAPTFMAIYSITSPKFRNPGRTYLPEKKLSAPSGYMSWQFRHSQLLPLVLMYLATWPV